MSLEKSDTPGTLIGSGRVALVLEYNGSQYHGWQSQKSGLPTVQQQLEIALSKVANHPVAVVCAGRTDAGVHASHQVIHFDTSVSRPFRSWVMGANANLPNDISVHWVGNVTEAFHARFSAKSRRYRYVIYNNPIRPALYNKEVTWNYRPLDEKKMARAAEVLIGEHDFSSFRAAGCQAKSPVRTIESLSVTRFCDFIVIDIQANAFLHHMVRNISGVLMSIGAGIQHEGWAEEVLQAKDRAEGGVTAPPFGLYFIDVGYEVGEIPVLGLGPSFIKPYYL
ncbi:tRNA pseudouridine(38-40) synthase TruA [Alkalimarinus alittae]|uniref:tRNA pseudouridine synthase A n=1 Tax=Alkalimarinus alittae TaxID=2961619 RepID=A0ABY6N762_9ALTE|nr:tRNA pseudouridine(38-40) synthase TruA [Alkalimarinus alittae]UZE97854.1 tRNA pseudouridine(38-40) synthase TruA [Alkalimarinus alittae]